MATLKRHWGNAAQSPGFIPSAACGRDSVAHDLEVRVTSAKSFNGSAIKHPDWYCRDCAKAARLALAKESAPKPSDVAWPKPRPISEVSEPYPDILGWCPGFGWRHLFHDAGWVGVGTDDSYEPTHFLPLPPEVK